MTHHTQGININIKIASNLPAAFVMIANFAVKP
jgi:hypothetical protein